MQARRRVVTRLPTPERMRCVPLWLKVAYTTFVVIIIWPYLRQYGWRNFLWFSDVALFAERLYQPLEYLKRLDADALHPGGHVPDREVIKMRALCWPSLLRRRAAALQDPLRALELTPTCGRETLTCPVDEVLDHADARAQAFG
jgi:hypothetical protein